MQRREDRGWGEGAGSGVCEAGNLHRRLGEGSQRKAEDRLKYFFKAQNLYIQKMGSHWQIQDEHDLF